MYTIDKDIMEMVKKIKAYQSKIYKLTPLDLAEFVKIKSNLMIRGLILTDSLLSQPDDVIANKIMVAMRKSDNNVDEEILFRSDINNLTNMDTSVIEEDRIAVRSQLFGNNIAAKVSQQGKAFTINWNNKMNICKINFPSEWKIDIEQMLLLKSYNSTFECKPTGTTRKVKEAVVDVKEVEDSIAEDTNSSIITSMIEMFPYTDIIASIENNEHNFDLPDEHQSLLNEGYSKSTAIFISHAVNSLSDNSVSFDTVLSCMEPVSIRKRVINTINNLYNTGLEDSAVQ